ncbi:hypothetical protein BP5796_00633 [Coleophoma crateriformis]|uniref:Cystinosin n=1 Tax=Coleophoma crateriformis TaxID=565419 RepID=A0A3D8T8I9_9HELO|nr:hypothetical protein BP5796_00633 [Coleophoma crateriformis]
MAFTFIEGLSLCFGWIYMFCWSASFYPQPLLNWRRKTTSGVNVDFPTINVLGFVAYLTSNCAYRYSPTIRSEYAARNNGLEPLVALNDVIFAGHAVILTVITLSQFLAPSIWGFEKRSKRANGARLSWGTALLMIVCLIYVGVIALLVLTSNNSNPQSGWATIDIIFAIANVKLIITVVKYMPQVLTNWRNRSTHGWSIYQILLDFAGGILSNAQLGLDAYMQGDVSNVIDNPVKLGLGNVSIFFDIIFIVQHYVLYAGSNGKDSEIDPLLDSEEREERIE